MDDDEDDLPDVELLEEGEGGEEEGYVLEEDLEEDQQGVEEVEEEGDLDTDVSVTESQQAKEDLINRQLEEEEKAKLTEIYEQLLSENGELQSVLSQYFRNREFKASEDLLTKSKQEQKVLYERDSEIVTCLQDQIDVLNGEFGKVVRQFDERIGEAEGKLKALHAERQKAFKTVPKEAVYSASGVRMDPKCIAHYMEKLDLEEQHRNRVRLAYLKELTAVERIKEQHDILEAKHCSMTVDDHEIMVAETNMLNARAMEKKRTVVQLRTNCLDAVNVVSHLKHKLYYLRKDKTDAKTKIRSLQEQADRMTKELMTLKEMHCRTTKHEIDTLRKQFMIIKDELLPEDYEGKRKEFKEFMEELTHLKEEYALLLDE